MQKLRTKSQARLFDKQVLPALKTNSTSFMGKTIIPIAKFDLQSNLVLKQEKKLDLLTKIQVSDSKPKSKYKIKKNFFQGSLLAEQMFKLITSDSKRQKHQNFDDFLEKNSSKNLLNIQPSKTSSKSYGIIKGYAANSHPGLFSHTNEDRICIVTNLNKTNIKPKQVLFFSIYDGSNGLLKTDYFRDHFHLILNADEFLLTDPEKAIRNTIQKIQKALGSQQIYTIDNSKVSYAILISLNDTAYLVVYGNCRIIVSKNYGAQIEKVVSTISTSVKPQTLRKTQKKMIFSTQIQKS